MRPRVGIAGGLALLVACGRPPSIPVSVTVSGTVLDLDGLPLAGAQVRIGGAPSATSAADGRFGVSGVRVPYDAILLAPGASGGTLVTAYQGLSRTDPVLRTFGAGPRPYSASLAGSVAISGVAFPLASNAAVKTSFGTPDLRLYVFPDKTTGAWSESGFTWSGAATQVGTMRALSWVQDANGLPTAYTGFGTLPLAFSSGANLSGQAVSLQPVGQGFVSGTVRHPADAALGGRNAYVTFGPNTQIGLAFESPPPGSPALPDAYSFVVPSIGGSSIYVWAFASKATGSSQAARAGLAAGASGADLVLPEAPEALTPASGASEVGHLTPFSWKPFTGGVHALQVFSNAVPGSPSYWVVTSAAEARIPDLSSAGLVLPLSTAYEWFVTARAPCASVDEAASLDGCRFFGDTYLQDYRAGDTAVRTFTTISTR